MHVLYVHKNYPAQFGHVASYLARNKGFRCTFVTERPEGTTGGVRRIQYKVDGGPQTTNHYCSRSFESYTRHSHAVYEAMKAHPEVRPDLVVGHSGFGSTVFLADLYGCPIINYFEWYYHSRNSDADFRQEFPNSELNTLRTRTRNAALLADLQTCATGYCPTDWQRSQLPSEYQHKLETIFDGVDTDLWKPEWKTRRGACQIGDRKIPAGTRIVTYVARGFESMRGFDIFMKVAQRICRKRSDVMFICVGADRVCYGGDEKHIKESSFREHVLAQDNYDLSRFIFTGQIPPADLVKILNLSDLHIYLTVPFVLSWSLMNALACGCTVLASDTAPVREMIDHGRNGLLTAFYDVDHFTQMALDVLDDPKAYRPLGEAGVEMIQQEYSMKQSLPKMLALYERALKGRGGDARLPVKRETLTTVAGQVEGKGIAGLKQAFPWPKAPPSEKPCKDGVWLGPGNRRLLDASLNQDTRLVLDLGNWNALTTRHIAKSAPRATIISVDHPPLGTSDGDHPHWKSMVGGAHSLWIANAWDLRERIVPVRATTTEGLRLVKQAGIQPELIHFDPDHSRDEFQEAIELARRLFPRATLLGDDWLWSRARAKILEVAARYGYWIEVCGNAWKLWRDESGSAEVQLAPTSTVPLESSSDRNASSQVSFDDSLDSSQRATATSSRRILIQSVMMAPIACDQVRILEPQAQLSMIPGVRTHTAVRELDLNVGRDSVDSDNEEKILIWQRPILHRPKDLGQIRQLIEEGYLIVIEYDDDPFRRQDHHDNDFLTFRGAHCIQTSTEPLAEVLRELNPNVAVFPNQIAQLPPPREYQDNDQVTVFFGALNREKDWQPIMPALNEMTTRYGDRLAFHVLHDRQFFDALETEHKQFEPWSPYERYLEVLGMCDVALLPLLDNRVNRMKSDLKFIQCAAHGVAALASPIVYAETIDDGATGLIYRSVAEFQEKLSYLIENREARLTICRRAYDYVRDQRMLSHHAGARYQWYLTMLDRRGTLIEQIAARVPDIVEQS